MCVVKNNHNNVFSTPAQNIVMAKIDPDAMLKGITSGLYQQDVDGLHKLCNRCNEYWPADSEFYFSDKKSTDGFLGFCKACYVEKRFPNGRKKPTVKQRDSTSMLA